MATSLNSGCYRRSSCNQPGNWYSFWPPYRRISGSTCTSLRKQYNRLVKHGWLAAAWFSSSTSFRGSSRARANVVYGLDFIFDGNCSGKYLTWLGCTGNYRCAFRLTIQIFRLSVIDGGSSAHDYLRV